MDESITLDPNSRAPLPTPYQDFVSDTQRYTSIGFENVVDHTLASNEAAARYVAGSARVIYADTTVPDYLNTLSDHRPVTSSYAFSAETGPFLRLKSPQGGAYQAGSVLPITWTSFPTVPRATSSRPARGWGRARASSSMAARRGFRSVWATRRRPPATRTRLA